MACGMQQYEFSATITGFFYILMYVLDFSAGACHFSWNLRIDSTNPLLVERIFNQIARNNNLRIHKVRSSKQGGNFRCNFSAKRQIDTDALTEDIKELCGEEVIFTRFDWELNKNNFILIKRIAGLLSLQPIVFSKKENKISISVPLFSRIK